MRDQLNEQITDVADRLKIDGQLRKATEGALETNDRYFDAVLDANRRAVKFAVTTADRVIEGTPEMPYDLPFADRVPSPSEAGDRYLDVFERAVQANRDFNERVIKMLEVEPVAPKARSPRKPAGTTARKATTKQATRARRTSKSTSSKSTPASTSATSTSDVAGEAAETA